jgi:cardiolipin synthase
MHNRFGQGLIWAGLLLVAACTALETAPALVRLLAPHEARLDRLLAAVYGKAPMPDGGRITAQPATDGTLPERWRRAEADLFFTAEGPVQADARYYFPGIGAQETWVRLHYLPPTDVTVTFSCDAEARLTGLGAAAGGRIRPGQPFTEILPHGADGRARLELGPGVGVCEMRWGEGSALRLVREETARPDLAALDSRSDLCATPAPARLDALEKAFYSDRWLSQSCAMPPGPVALLGEPIEAVRARLAALTGRPLSDAALLSGDPDQPLDFSHAPDLDLIYISYLLIRADYSGYLMMRALEHHAARGTVVRILVTDKLMRDKDRWLFEGLAARYPNIQLQYFVWDTPGPKDIPTLIDLVQRTHHIKVFATLARQPGRSRLIVGGRNVWDGFFFDHPFDLTAHPELRTYNETSMQGLTYYSIYQDFDVELSSDAAVRTVAAHLSTFWHRDGPTQIARPMAVDDPARRGTAAGGMRHFLSLPWADGRAQEFYFAELIDAAEREIIIVTPFMYPPPTILEAMLRARARGVRVKVVARISSTDPSGSFITALNLGFVRRWGGDFEVYEYTPGERMMHTKLILIDGRLSVVTSSNMNRRSYIHDSENGLVFLDRGVTRRLVAFVDGYLETAKRMPPGGELSGFAKIVNAAKAFWQYF